MLTSQSKGKRLYGHLLADVTNAIGPVTQHSPKVPISPQKLVVQRFNDAVLTCDSLYETEKGIRSELKNLRFVGDRIPIVCI